MKYLIFSDIHGSFTAAQKMITIFEKTNADMMLILGDILYHGPRNPLPEGHDPKAVVQLLNAYKDRILSVRGNCDTEVDQMVLEFPCLSDYMLLVDEGKRMFLTHGHKYTPSELPQLQSQSIYLYGHTHLYELEFRDDLWMCNPGSIALPKENRPPTYMIYESGYLSIWTLKGEKLKEIYIM